MSELKTHNCFLPLVSRPSRYIGGEVNSVKKDLSKVKLKFGMAFPDVYDVGMSHLGIQILYQILNAHPDIACERVYAPWTDMEKIIRTKGIPLSTLESNIPLKDLDILGFSLQYELSYTNVLNMLDLGGIPLYSKDRDERFPIVIGGGPCAFNPEPVADFFDCSVLGDGEEVIIETAEAIIKAKGEGLKAKDWKEIILEKLAEIEGMYVPSLFDVRYNDDGIVGEIVPLNKNYNKIKKRLVPDLNNCPLPTKPVVPFTKTIHDRFVVEITRGCTRGCRFCQAGIIYRPSRERSPENVLKIIDEALKNTGYDEVSILSLSSGDYSCINELVLNLMNKLYGKKVALSLPSMRVGTLTPELVNEIKRVRKTGFTLAPEAGTERLRGVINKGIGEDALLKSCRNIFEMGWRSVKLYFMLGLPTETIDDVKAIAELSERVKRQGTRGLPPKASIGGQVNVSVSTFIPKPHTPFQWEQQITISECRERQELLRKELKKRRLEFKWHDARMSLLEGVFSRGDRRLAKIIESAFKMGCRFDGWGEVFRFDLWERMFNQHNIAPEFYLRKRDHNEILPWVHLTAGITEDFLEKECKLSLESKETPDCKPVPAGSKRGTDKCSNCGICDHKVIKNVSSKQYAVCSRNMKDEHQRKPLPTAYSLLPTKYTVRLSFSKTDNMKYLGHLELMSAFSRAIRRAGIPIKYSAGFHPLPEMVFEQPLPVGVESIAEHADIEIDGYVKPEEIKNILNRELPSGLKILDAVEIPLRHKKLSATIKEKAYLVFLDSSITIREKDIRDSIENFLKKGHVVIKQQREDKTREIDIKPLVQEIVLKPELTIGLTLASSEKGTAKPHEVIAYILGIPNNDAVCLKILKVK
ncbi:MAG: TIGR03960 family B12-binding radical SAM protein [Deltaproteobacteria bacterium]|nr:TIGR03960 family B12-binding radical SAM protein [Deltaproteobacteria bacterium]